MSTSALVSVIREAQPLDAERIVDILVDSFSDKFKPIFGEKIRQGKEALTIYYKQPGALNDAIITEANSEIAGIIQLQTTESSRGKKPLGLLRKLGFLGAIRAVLALIILSHKVEADECYVEHLAVASAFRGRGFGKQLLCEGESFAKLRQKRFYSLFVASDNYTAKSLYEQMGFLEAGTKRSILIKLLLGKQTFVFMKKHLSV